MNENKTTVEFVGFPKIARYSREIVATEKIDGTNAQVFVTECEGYPVDGAVWQYEKDVLGQLELKI